MRALPLLLLILLLLLAPGWSAAKEVPFLTGRVNDQANLLTPEQRQRIEQKLAEFERQTTNQIAVLTVESLEGDPIEDFAHRVAETWKLGTAEKDNGALLLVASGDRKMRIEVGYGLEPELTDLQTNVIQNDVIIPYFKRGDFGGGIEAGVDAMISTVQGKAVEPAVPAQGPSGGGRGGGGGGGFLLFLVFLLFPFSLDALRSRSWIMYLFLIPFYFFLGFIISPILGMIAAGAWIVLFPILRMVVPKSALGSRRRGGGWFIGPGMGGGGWRGGGGGWGGGGGGFSGGGGSFGGGGSSSSW
ncbi:MAG TPA: TPM domain-containing protein [Thermoanaerobaculia bacterium]